MVEVLIGLGIAAVGLLGALAMLGVLFRGAAYSRNMSDAMALTQSKLEAEVSRGSISLTSPANGATTEAPLDALGQSTGAGPFLFTRTTTWALSTDGNRRKVTVSVAFIDSIGATHTLSAERERNLP
jgi:Tfp pilus assembly protein PilV